MNAKDRYYSKREAGISPVRSDGSVCSVETDVNAAGAEKIVAASLGCEYNDTITIDGDEGYDFILPLEVEVIWLGFHKNTTIPRESGHLIVNPYEPHRWADIYIVAAGSHEKGYKIVGWTTHKALAQQPKKDFGYGPKLAMHTDKLWSIERLRLAKREL